MEFNCDGPDRGLGRCGHEMSLLDGNTCGAGKQDAELMLPITPANCDPSAEATEFTEYLVEMALTGAPGRGVGVSTCGTESTEAPA